LLASPSEIRATIVEETWVGGRPMYRRSDAQAGKTPIAEEKATDIGR
jgi:hypothetical protein